MTSGALAEHTPSRKRKQQLVTTQPLPVDSKISKLSLTVPDAVILLAVMGKALNEHALPKHLRGLSLEESRHIMLFNFDLTESRLDELIVERRKHEGVFKVGPILHKLYRNRTNR